MVFVSPVGAARFVNWLSNGQGGGGTESGSSTLGGGTPFARTPAARAFLPSADEWYKAAFYKGGSSKSERRHEHHQRQHGQGVEQDAGEALTGRGLYRTRRGGWASALGRSGIDDGSARILPRVQQFPSGEPVSPDPARFETTWWSLVLAAGARGPTADQGCAAASAAQAHELCQGRP